MGFRFRFRFEKLYRHFTENKQQEPLPAWASALRLLKLIYKKSGLSLDALSVPHKWNNEHNNKCDFNFNYRFRKPSAALSKLLGNLFVHAQEGFRNKFQLRITLTD